MARTVGLRGNGMGTPVWIPSFPVLCAASVAAMMEPGRVSGAEDELPTALKSLVSRRTLKRARILGAAIRSAHMLSIGRPGIIDETPLTYEGGKLVLTLPPTHRDLDGERLRRRFEVLAQLVDQRPEIRYS